MLLVTQLPNARIDGRRWQYLLLCSCSNPFNKHEPIIAIIRRKKRGASPDGHEILENQQLALLGVNVAESKLLDQKAQEIAELEGVISVAIVSGRYDLLVEILVASNKGLIQFLTKTLSTIKGISKTETFVMLKTHKKWL